MCGTYLIHLLATPTDSCGIKVESGRPFNGS